MPLLLCSMFLFQQHQEDRLLLFVDQLIEGHFDVNSLNDQQKSQLIMVLAQKVKEQAGLLQGEKPDQEVDSELVEQIKKRYQEAMDHFARLEFNQAETKMNQMLKDYPGFDKSKSYGKYKDHAKYVGMDAVPFEVADWLQASGSVEPETTTLLVWWESWCPHCQEDMPKMQAFFEANINKGLMVISLTKLIEPANLNSAYAFISERNIELPVALATGKMMEAYGVKSVPAAVFLKDNKVIWRGKPEWITQETIDKALSY